MLWLPRLLHVDVQSNHNANKPAQRNLFIMKVIIRLLAATAVGFAIAQCSAADGPPRGEMLCDHVVVLDGEGKLLPWTSFDSVIVRSMNYIKSCPTVPTKFGDDPWYLVTSKLTADAKFKRNQNCQGSHAYWGVETLIRYYAYSGDEDAIRPVRLILERIMNYHTPSDWNWPNVPRTQDNSPDGEYTDEVGEPDKMALVGVAYLRFYKLTGDEKYLVAARAIAKSVALRVTTGDATNSPLPFRVNMKTGRIMDAYTSHMIAPVLFFHEMIQMDMREAGLYQSKRDLIWNWIVEFPIANHEWSGYYEDVKGSMANKNQQNPMETARFILRNPALDPDASSHVERLLDWVKHRFGQTKRFGATSIREQDGCFFEMSSHTARYASIVARKFGVSQDPKDREEARASFALATYSSYSKYSRGENSVNYTGIGYANPWFTDSYFDYLSHLLDGMAELPEMAPVDSDHIIGSTSVINKVKYQPGRIEYTAYESPGTEILRLSFIPRAVTVEGKPLPATGWTYGAYRGVPGVLRISREKGGRNVTISRE